MSDWQDKHQFECVGGRSNEEEEKKRPREEPLILIGIDGYQIEVDMAIVGKIGTIFLLLEDDKNAESLTLPVRTTLLRQIAVFAIDGGYPEFQNLDHLSEFLNASNYLDVEGVSYAGLMEDFKAEIMTRLIESKNTILMDLIKEYFFPLLSLTEIKNMFLLDNITDTFRLQLKNELIERAIRYFPKTFAKWGTQGLSNEQKERILEVLFIYEAAKASKIYRTAAIREYNIPAAAFKNLPSQKFKGSGPEVFYNLSDILDVMLVKYGSLEEMERKKNTKNEKKAAKQTEKKRKAQLEEEEKERKYNERKAKGQQMYDEAKQVLVAKYGPYVIRYMDAACMPYATASSTAQLVQIFTRDMFYYIQNAHLAVFKTRSDVILRLTDIYLTRNIDKILSGQVTKLREFTTFVNNIISRMRMFNELFKKNAFVVDVDQFFEKFQMQLIDLSDEDLYAVILHEYDAMYTEFIRTRNYSELQRVLRPEKYVEVYEQIHGNEDNYMFLQMELTKIE